MSSLRTLPLLLCGLLLGASPARAARNAAEIAVVGLHLASTPEEAAEAASRVTAALKETGRFAAVGPVTVDRRVGTRGELVIDGAFLGAGRKHLAEGRVLYERADFEGAVELLTLAVGELESGLASATTNKDLVDALLLLALCQLSAGDEGAVAVTLRRVVVVDPTRELDAVNYPPGLVDLHKKTRTKVLSEQKSRITLSGAGELRRFVDGAEILGADVSVPAGQHTVMATDEAGHREFARMILEPGQRITVNFPMTERLLGEAAGDPDARSEQTRWLYSSLAPYTGSTLVLLGGTVGKHNVGAQLYEPRTGNFSKEVVVEAGSDPVGALIDLLPTLSAYVGDNGGIRSDRVSTRPLALDISRNIVLTDILLANNEETAPAEEGFRPKPWMLWTALGVAVTGGATGIAVALSTDEGNGNGGTPPDEEATGGTVYVSLPN